MDYKMMIPSFEHRTFSQMTKKECEMYFRWYIAQIEERISVLEQYICSTGGDVVFDYSPESLKQLWGWYEERITLIPKSEEELTNEKEKYPEWMHNYLSKTKISYHTLMYGMDVAIYFGEVIIRNSNARVNWGYFNKPKSRMSVNEPVLLGFVNGMDLNPRLVVINCSRRSSTEKKAERLLEMYYEWMKMLK